MSAHTPGPWSLIFHTGFDGSQYIVKVAGLDGEKIAVNGLALTGGEEADANARLIAAAPDLLEAARLTMLAVDDEYRLRWESDDYIYDTVGSSLAAAYFAARAAIAKATGETP